ncbi:MAG: ATPase, T2SS/T4P/T4SS family [Acidobacteriota bacterium]|nr:ATPase, T2SS/T4P/T4SS family [Acidobacteriota bacterium]
MCIRIAFARGASSLFLTSDSRPSIRVEGDIRLLDNEAVLSKADVEAAIMEIVPQEAQESVGSGQATEWIAQLPGLGGIRCTSWMDHRGPGVVFTMIATRAATAEQLGLTREIQALATEAEGLVLVAGSRGSGKSTLMSALVDLVNHQRAEYVITLERQIRLVHDNHTALVSQREIRGGADEALAAARGLLVFVSITAPSTSDAVERLLDLAPAGARTSVQAAMAESFRGAVSQVLLKKTGGGRVVAREIMLATAAVTRLIGDGQLGQLPLALESGRRHGMVPLTDVLLGLVQSGVVDVREAFRKTHDRDRLLSGLKREGVDTSVVERLA